MSSSVVQERYFQHLCQQAGLPAPCALPVVDRKVWTLIVRQGMNDIDRRCDGYLQWLDDAKRSKTPLLNQISDTQSGATALLALTHPRPGAALQIVAQAFNLVSRSIVNYQSRLIDVAESSTINSVVLRARHAFRRSTGDSVFSTRPDAEYVLRSYLRLCLPFSIETEINDFSTFGSRGIAAVDDFAVNQAPLAGDAFVPSAPSAPSTLTNRPVVRPPREPSIGAETDVEGRVAPGELRAFQRLLCLKPDGKFGERTRVGIRIFQSYVHTSPGDSKKITGFLNTPDDVNELRTQAKQGPCGAPFRNYYERQTFAEPDAVRDLALGLQADFPEIRETSSLETLRPFIERKRELLGLEKGPDGFLADQITRDFTDRVLDKQ